MIQCRFLQYWSLFYYLLYAEIGRTSERRNILNKSYHGGHILRTRCKTTQLSSRNVEGNGKCNDEDRVCC